MLAVTMDIPASDAYLRGMFARLVTMLAIFAITVVTTVTSAHAAHMSTSAGPDHATHVAAMMPSSGLAQLACDGGQHCGPADAGMCEFVCASLSAFPISTGGEAGLPHGAASRDLPSGATRASRAPGLNERPPKLRLL